MRDYVAQANLQQALKVKLIIDLTKASINLTEQWDERPRTLAQKKQMPEQELMSQEMRVRPACFDRKQKKIKLMNFV